MKKPDKKFQNDGTQPVYVVVGLYIDRCIKALKYVIVFVLWGAEIGYLTGHVNNTLVSYCQGRAK